MLKCASIYTYEIDDPEKALEELRTQLNEKLSLLQHTVGIIMCHTEFIASGVTKYVGENLPFELAGVTTAAQAVNGEVGELILTIFVMTSDDVRFRTGVTDPLDKNIDLLIKTAYENTSERSSEEPGLVLAFPPFGLRAGDEYVRAWGKILPKTPVFGTLAIDDTATFSECETLYNGINYKTAMPFVLCYGNITPRFFIATLSENSALAPKAKATKAVGNCVYEINQINAYKYFEELEFTESVMYTPFMIDFIKREDYDGVPVIRGYAAFTDEGAAVFHGDIDEGSTFTMLKCDSGDMLTATRQKIETINSLPDVNGALLFPCVVRRMALLAVNKPLLELEIAGDMINADMPFMMGYAGGEICPTSVKNGSPTNRFHNYSLVILIV